MKTIGLEEPFIIPELFGYSASTKNYPFEEISLATEFLRNAPISEADRAKISHENAEKLLHLSK